MRHGREWVVLGLFGASGKTCVGCVMPGGGRGGSYYEISPVVALTRPPFSVVENQSLILRARYVVEG
jgi:hypothetical protein